MFKNRLVLVGVGFLVSASSFAADESGITTADTLAVIADGKAKLIILALAAAGAMIALKWVKKVRSAA